MLRRLVAFLLALVGALAIGTTSTATATTTASAAIFTYDAQPVARVDTREIATGAAQSPQVSGVRDGSVSPSTGLRGTSTTPARSLNATNLVDDVLPKPVVSNPKLSNIVDDLYKGTTNPGRVGTGTTADAVLNEARTGLPTGGKFHTIKAEQYSNALRAVLKNGDLSAGDRLVAQSLLDELQAALGATP